MSRSLSSRAAAEYVEQDFLDPAVAGVVERGPPVPGAELGVGPVADHELDQVEVAAHAEPLQRCLPHGIKLVQVDAMTRAAEKVLQLLVVSLLGQLVELLLEDGVVFAPMGGFGNRAHESLVRSHGVQRLQPLLVDILVPAI